MQAKRRRLCDLGIRDAIKTVHFFHRFSKVDDLDFYEVMFQADPIILSVGEADELTIKDVAYGVSRALGIPDEKVKFDTTKADGQYKKTANNAKLMKLNPDFKFTPFNKAIEMTVKWFLENYDKEGGIRK